MKVKEFVEKYKKMSAVQSVKNLIATKNYVPYMEKQALVKKIADKCMIIDSGYVRFDEMHKYIVFTLEVIGAYTNLEFDENFNIAVTEYDELCDTGALNSVIETFEGEYKSVLNMLNMHQDYILQGNRIEAQIAKFLDGLSDKLDSVIDIFSERLGDYKELNITPDDIEKLTSFISTLGK